jgi:uncharacterized protein (DUF1778 family)
MNNYSRIEIYATNEQKHMVKKIAKQKGKSVSKLLLEAVLNSEVKKNEKH